MNDWLRLAMEVSLRMAVLAACVYAILAAGRIRSGAVRHAAWTAVLGAMLLMPGLVRFTPAVEFPVTMELLEPGPPAAEAMESRPAASALNSTAAPAPENTGDAPWRPDFTWSQGVVALYAAGLVWLLAGVAWGWRGVRAIADSAEPVALAVPGAQVCQSSRVTAPVTMGIWRPRIVLPVAWAEWPGEKLRAVLAHEGAHVRRRDALVSLAAQVNRCLFWFHPLAWWLERQLSVTAEHACDEAGVQAAGDNGAYAQVLLDMAEMVRRQGGRLGMQGIGMSGGGGLEERIDRILRLDQSITVPRTRKALVGMSCAIAIFAAAACRQQTAVIPPAQDKESLGAAEEAQQLLRESRADDPQAATRLASFRQKMEQTANVPAIVAGVTPLVSICWSVPKGRVTGDELFATGKALAERAMKLEPQSAATRQLMNKIREIETMCNSQKLMNVRWNPKDAEAQKRLTSVRQNLEQATELPVLLGGATPLISMRWPTQVGPAAGAEEFAVGKAAVERALQRDPESAWARQLMNKIRDQELVARLPEAVWSGPLESRHKAIQALPEGERFRELAILAVSAGDEGVRAAVIAKDPAGEKAQWQEAGRYAAEALAIAPRARDHADYGTAWFTANMVAGVAAALAGDQKAAAEYGRKAMDAPPTDALRYPIVNARPWPMNWHFPAQLVAALLRAGERDASVEILERYARLTEVDKGRWQADIAVIRKGELPAWAGR